MGRPGARPVESDLGGLSHRQAVVSIRPNGDDPPVQGVETDLDRPLLRDRRAPWLIGVIHLPPLPGAPRARIPVPALARWAAEQARVLQGAGFTAVMVENYHDVPFTAGRVAPETVAAMAVVAREVTAAVEVPVGVNVLRNDALAALAVCASSGASFLRVNVLSGSAITDQGPVHGEADTLLRRRAALGCDDVAILADVDVKHATSLDTRPLPIRARDLAARGGADAVLVTGDATGLAVDQQTLGEVAEAVAPTPVLAASGTTPEQLPDVLQRCAGTVVGTALKNSSGDIDPELAAAYVRHASR